MPRDNHTHPSSSPALSLGVGGADDGRESGPLEVEG
jgi:hypothetical protein